MEFNSLDSLWVILSAALVFVMQAGFLCLESGSTRTKNSINVAVKNLTDFGMSVFAFWILGFGLMFGASQHGLFGGSLFLFDSDSHGSSSAAFFIFQVMFCGTSVTIVSGAVAERMSFKAYLFVSILVSALIYPVFGHWVWGGALGGEAGWLAKLGFVDFAGSSVVHSIGGWVSLACIIVIGPRIGRFDENGKPRDIHGQSLPLALLGTLLLCFGWIGFNGGSTLAWGAEVPSIVIRTILAACSGMLTALLIGYVRYRYPDLKYAMNGTISGLVAITAGCHMVSSMGSVVIGAIGAVVMVCSEHLLERAKLDDVVGAFSVHGVAGVWGTVAVALFGDVALFPGNVGRLDQFGVQVLGTVVCAVVAFVPAYLFLKLLSKGMALRVGAEQELVGLNASEHNVSTEHLDLLREMELQSQRFDPSRRVHVEPFTEIGQIAQRYNEVLDSLEETVARNEVIIQDTKDGILTCCSEGLIVRANPGAVAMFEVDVDTLEGRSLWELVVRAEGDSLQSFGEMIKAAGSYGTGHLSRPLVGIRSSGERFSIETEITEGKVGPRRVMTVKIRDCSQSEQYREMLLQAKRVAETTRDELEEKVNQVEAFNELAIGRELRMIELKREINGLSRQLKKDAPFKSVQPQ